MNKTLKRFLCTFMALMMLVSAVPLAGAVDPASCDHVIVREYLKDADGNVMLPTCTTEGKYKEYCENCGTVFGEYTEPASHIIVTLPAVAPTCTQTGLTEGKKCSRCDAVLEAQKVVAATGHTLDKEADSYLPFKAPTCTESGLTEGGVCTVCDETVAQVTIAPYGHNFTNKVVKEDATCTTDGLAIYTCSICAATKEEVIPAAHTFSDSVTYVKAPTCTEDGTGVKTCTKCQAKEEVEVPALGHSFTGDAVNIKNGEHAFACVHFGCEVTGTVVEVTDETTGETTTVQKVAGTEKCSGGKATCVSGAICEKCATAYGNVDPENHIKIVVNEKVEPTCQETGHEAYRSCASKEEGGCGVMIDEFKKIDKVPCSYTKFEYNKDATCTANGTATAKCDFGCGSEKTIEEPGSALGHDPENIEEVAPTCIRKGVAAGIRCKRCKTNLKGFEEIPALGHSEYIAVAEVAPTCTKVGATAEKRCSRCDMLLSAPSMTISALGHTDEDGDGVCDRTGCNTIMNADGDSCSCLCHKTGFMKLIYIIVRYFWSLFHTNQWCDCGVQHY